MTSYLTRSKLKYWCDEKQRQVSTDSPLFSWKNGSLSTMLIRDRKRFRQQLTTGLTKPEVSTMSIENKNQLVFSNYSWRLYDLRYSADTKMAANGKPLK